MSKIEFNTEDREVTITRRIGRGGESTVTLSPEEAGIEINLGIAKIGATTDFGGAISLGIAGQEVTWGREGGTIHIGIGGFAVDVEARDCIVTEVKSIFGIIVAQRSYPDPGCELPEPFVPPEQEPPPPPDGDDGTNRLKTGLAWVFCKGRTNYSNVFNVPGYPTVFLKNEGYSERTITSSDYTLDQNGRIDTTKCREIAKAYIQTTVVSGEPPPEWYQTTIGNLLSTGNRVTSSNSLIQTTAGPVRLYEFFTYQSTRFVKNPPGYNAVLPRGGRGWMFHGDQVGIKAYIQKYNADAAKTATTTTELLQVIKVIPIGLQKPPAPLLPTGNKPPMKDCCDDIRDMLEDIKEAYAVDRILKDKFPVSNAFMAPECDTASQTQAKNFYEILQCLFRMLAHGLIFEPRVLIKDADAAKAGDQEFKARYLNATGWASAVAEALMEVKDDGNVSTNMDIRNSFASTQTMVGLADAIYKLEAVIDMLGVEVIPKMETVETPFNVQIQIGKGFGDGNERQIDLNQDEATEKLLPTLLQTKKNKIKTIDIHPRSRSIKEILENIEANLPGINNG